MTTNPGPPSRSHRVGLVTGPLAAVLVYVAVPDAALDSAGRATIALGAWMAVWWLTEAIPVSATALLPLAVLPLATHSGHGSAAAAMRAAAEPYANPFIALFLGGFVLALAMERWGLHRRIALLTLRRVGTRPRRMIGGFMAITAALSMWVSNTATTVMMLPIAMSVLGLVEGWGDDTEREGERSPMVVCLLLGIAYAASIGGIGTLIGTPPNLLLAGFLEKTYGLEVSFVRWLGIGLPLVAVFVPLTWWLLTRVIYPVGRAPIEGARTLIADAHAALGPMKPGEWATAVVFVMAALAWIGRPLITKFTIGGAQPFAALTDPGIAIIAALMLFVIPVDRGATTFVMDWRTARRLPWGILILFGGGLSLAAAVTRHGVAEYIGAQTRFLEGVLPLLVVVAVTTGVILLTELTSNTATTATLLPLLASVAPALGLDPLMLLVPAAIAASCAFMMPVATPPNAIVFGSRCLSIPQMCRAGIWLNLIGVVLVTGLTYALVIPLLIN